MKGPPAPQDWKGDLNISEYRLGPGFIKEKYVKTILHKFCGSHTFRLISPKNYKLICKKKRKKDQDKFFCLLTKIFAKYQFYI